MKIEKDEKGNIVAFTMTLPDDWHLHIRDGAAMSNVVGYSARRFGRAIIMPNLKPPITTNEEAFAYLKRILMALPRWHAFEPLMTLYLTDNTSPDEIIKAKENGFVHAVKLYPAGATTNSDAGVTDIKRVFPVLRQMEKAGMVLCVHGEVADPSVDIFDREKVFIDRILSNLIRYFPGLKIVLEHVTTQDGVDFVTGSDPNIGATITAHHLLINRNVIFQGGLRPHNYCLPVAKREEHRQALVRAATSGNPKFFLGTDSAPHAKDAKENACGCAGCFTAHAAIELYAEAFERVDKLEMLERFASFYGANFYGLPRNESSVTLVKENWDPAKELPFGENQTLVPFRADTPLRWNLQQLQL